MDTANDPASGDRDRRGLSVSTLTVTAGSAVTVHTFTAGETGWRSNSHLIELPRRLVLIDAPLQPDDAKRIRVEIERLDKPLDRIIVSHPHPDHFATAGTFGVPVHALEPVGLAIASAGRQQIGAAYLASGLAPQDAPALAPVTGIVEPGEEAIDGVGFRYLAITDAEASTQLAIGIASESMLFTGDLAYAGVHPFLAARNIETWLTAIEQLEGLPHDVVFPGHGLPGASALVDTAAYLRAAAGPLAEARDGAQLNAALDGAFPEYEGRIMHAVQNAFLFPSAGPPTRS